jgi:hypothetical protein
MANPEKPTETGSGYSPARNPYSRPRLREFGHVQDLTQAGTGLKNEPTQGRPPPKSRA